MLGILSRLSEGEIFVCEAERDICRGYRAYEVVDYPVNYVEYRLGEILSLAVLPLLAAIEALVSADGLVKRDAPFVFLAALILLPRLVKIFSF